MSSRTEPKNVASAGAQQLTAARPPLDWHAPARSANGAHDEAFTGDRFNLICLSPYDLLRPRANQISDVRFCEGFARNGADVELIVPSVSRPDNVPEHRIFRAYGVETPFRLTMLRTPLRESSPRWYATVCIFVAAMWRIILRVAARGNGRRTVILSRSPGLLLPVIAVCRLLRRKRRPLVVSWAHEVSPRRRHHWVYRRSDAVVATNSAIADDLRADIGVPAERIAISLNPISTRQVRERTSRAAARDALGFDMERPLIVYTGKLYRGQKEADHIIEAASMMPQCRFLLTGGKPDVVDHFRRFCAERGIDNVKFTGYLPDYTRIATYQAAADVLIAYYSPADHEVRHNLPNKICEYMLTGNPIVTCDFPAVRDTINPDSAFFVPHDAPAALASGIQRVLSEPDHAAAVGENARRRVMTMTFDRRTADILTFFATLHG